MPVGIEVEQHEANEICDQLIIDLDKIENSLLIPWQKLDSIRTFLLPRLSYIVRVGDVKIKTLQNYRRKLINALKRICHLSIRATNHYFFARQSEVWTWIAGSHCRGPCTENRTGCKNVKLQR